MFEYGWSDLREALEGALGIFALSARCPVGLFEFDGEGKLSESASQGEFRSYCRLLQATPAGRLACQEDHLARAQQALDHDVPALTICHAGLFNQTIPVSNDAGPFAVLMYGQMRVTEDPRQGKAHAKMESAFTRLGISGIRAETLRQTRLEASELSRTEVAQLTQKLSEFGGQVLKALDRQRKRDERNMLTFHDLNIALQAVIARAENLTFDVSRLHYDHVARARLPDEAQHLLADCLRLRQLAWNLSDSVQEYEFTRFPLSVLVSEAVSLYRYEATEKHVEIRQRLEEPCAIDMSRDHLQQALNNLVQNAVKYSFFGRDDRTRYIDIIGTREDGYYALTVSDYGVGIEEDELERVFERGYKGRQTSIEFRSGSGLGLFSAREVVRRHGGHIFIASQPTSGRAHVVTITVELPYTHH